MNYHLNKKIIVSAVLGNVFEAYDATCFLFLAPFVANFFFSPDSVNHNLLKTLMVFLVGFLIRPLGGLVLGGVADMYGRKKSLVLSVLLASVFTSFIMLIPGYKQMGSLATFLLICCRLGQSFAMGGEYVTSVAFLIEHAPPEEKGYAGSWAALGANTGVLLAALSSGLVTYFISQSMMPVWAWRIPFLFSLIGIAVTYWIRRYALETLDFVLDHSCIELRKTQLLWQIIKDFLEKDKKKLAMMVGLIGLVSSSYYLVFTYGVLHQCLINHIEVETVWIMVFSLMLLILLSPVMGKISDRWGRDNVLFFSSLFFLCLVYPYFYCLSFSSFGWVIFFQCLIAIPAAGLYSVILTVIVEMIPLKARCSLGGSIYGVISGLFGGAAPLIAGMLIQSTGSPLSPAYYLIFCGLMGVAASVALRMQVREVYFYFSG
ncbi:MAG: MFS transporter [Gammaproteobacteria bacterium]|nr:MFS transporter [Gammaproteobacteria bacterium]